MYGYSPEVVRFSYQSTLDYYAALGIELSQADREQLAADTIDHFIGLGLIENKLRETGQDIITEEQAQSLRTHAQNLYESVWQGLYQELTASGEEVSEAQVSQWLEKQGYEITYLDVDENGLVKLDELTAAIRPDTILISVMFANNEIGTIEPIAEIGKIAHEHGVLFHTDAVQAYTQVPIDVEAMNIDMMSTSGHKINGPKGIGFLYIRKGVKIKSFIHGGAQERHRRAGTENVTGIIGLAKAAEIATANMKALRRRSKSEII